MTKRIRSRERLRMTHADVASFFDDFGKLFSDDGRAEAWVGSIEDEGLIVLDDNDLRYAYEPLDEFERILRDRGFAAGFPLLPSPHAHNFNEELNLEEARLRVVRLGQRASAGRRRVGKQRLLKEQAFYVGCPSRSKKPAQAGFSLGRAS